MWEYIWDEEEYFFWNIFFCIEIEKKCKIFYRFVIWEFVNEIKINVFIIVYIICDKRL